MFVNQITILQVITMYKSLIFSVFLSSLWICNLSQGFGIVVNFLKQPRHSSNIWLKLRLNDYNPKMVCGLTAFGQRFSFVVVYLFPDNCWKLTENWMKFNMFLTSINICVKEEYMACNTYFMLLLLLLLMNLTVFCSMQNQDLLQHFFLQLLCTFNSSQDIICSVYIDLLYHFLRL